MLSFNKPQQNYHDFYCDSFGLNQTILERNIHR